MHDVYHIQVQAFSLSLCLHTVSDKLHVDNGKAWEQGLLIYVGGMCFGNEATDKLGLYPHLLLDTPDMVLHPIYLGLTSS